MTIFRRKHAVAMWAWHANNRIRCQLMIKPVKKANTEMNLILSYHNIIYVSRVVFFEKRKACNNQYSCPSNSLDEKRYNFFLHAVVYYKKKVIFTHI